MKHKIFFDYEYQNNKKGATKALSHPLFSNFRKKSQNSIKV